MVAAIDLARSYSNVQQECDFAMAWNLVQRQKPLTFEKRLDAVPSKNLNTDTVDVIEIDHN